MSLVKDVLDSVEALKRASRDLGEVVEVNYQRGTRVSFKKFTYHGVPAPVLTGTIMWAQVREIVGIEIIVSIELDKEFLPCNWGGADLHQSLVRINILNEEYDFTIIS